VAQATYERGRRSLSAAEARALFQEAVRLDPSHAPSWNALGINAAMRGDRVEAERCFQAALRFDPGNADARWHLDRLRAAR
jgi:Flp pilus assembly protein TadD